MEKEDQQSPFIDPNNTVVLLIDMQETYLDGEKRKIIPNQISVIRACKQNNVPLIVIRFGGYGRIIPELRREIRKLRTVIRLTKWSNSTFETTRIAKILKKFKRKNLLLMGVNACACVLETAKDAVENGYTIITSDTLIAGFSSDEYSTKYREAEEEWYLCNGQYFKKHLPQIKGLPVGISEKIDWRTKFVFSVLNFGKQIREAIKAVPDLV
ncbi:MAG: isochorismatase family cysteine hydrolase [Patescibacteria group bacterium]